MELFDMLSATEKRTMECYIDEYAMDEDVDLHESRKAPLDYIMRVWNEQKAVYLSKLMKGQLILKKEVQFEKSRYELFNEIRDKLLNNSFAPLPAEDSEFIATYRSKFLNNKGDYYNNAREFDMYMLIDPSTLIDNVWERESFILDLPNGKVMKINHGEKVTRALGKIAKAFDIPGFERFRILHSQILNQKKLKGNLCLSIHPLDFMTMSDNASGWSSCMSWEDGGCYRMGTVEMMNSPMVLCAYLTGSAQMTMPDGTNWNNKKWRELYIVTPEIITNVKSYPYFNENLSREVLAWVKELAVEAGIGDYTEKAQGYKAFSWDFNEELNTHFYVDPYTYQMYNDFDHNHFCYLSKTLGKDKDLRFCYSGPTECMFCGGINQYFESEGYLVCSECEDFYYCAECGDRINPDESIEIDNELLCNYCYSHRVVEDAITGDEHLKDNCEKIYLATLKDNRYYYNRLIYIYVDDELSYKERLKEFFINPDELKLSLDNTAYMADVNNLTDEGFKLFGYESKKDFLFNIATCHEYSTEIIRSSFSSADFSWVF
jgi:DNA-directed RNA polymerase subunit RPC12/RpoP